MKKYYVVDTATRKQVSPLYSNRRMAMRHADQLNCENDGGYHVAISPTGS